MSKPLVIKIREAKESMVASINTAMRDGLPCYLLEPIIAELHRQVSDAAQTEYEQAQRQLAEDEAKAQLEKEKAEKEKKGADPEMKGCDP